MSAPAQSSAQRSRLLVLLLVLAVAFAVYRVAFRGDDSGVGANADDGNPAQATRPDRRGGGRSQVDPEQLRVAELDLAALDPQPRDTNVGRNLWKFHTPEPPPPPVLPPPPPRQPPPTPPPEPPPGPPPPPPPPPLPEVPYRYLGSFGPEARRIAVLEDGDRIINALVGDELSEEFVVAEIGYESIYIAYKNHPDEPAKQLEIGG